MGLFYMSNGNSINNSFHNYNIQNLNKFLKILKVSNKKSKAFLMKRNMNLNILKDR